MAPPVPVTRLEARPHQRGAFWFAFGRRAAMLAIAMRGGKSKVTVDLVVNRGHKLTIIICPENVVDTWPAHFEKHAGRPVRVLALGPKSGSIEERTAAATAAVAAAQATGQQLVIVVGYAMLLHPPFGPTITRDKRKRVRWVEDGWMLSTPWDFAVADESHHWKAHAGIGRRIGTRLGARVPYRLALTGTPLAQTPLDAWGQFMFLDPTVFGDSYPEFERTYALMNPNVPGKVLKYINEQDFESKFAQLAYIVTKDEIRSFVQRAEPNEIKHHAPLDSEGQRIYRELHDTFLADLGTGYLIPKNVMVRLLRLQQLTGGTLTDDHGTTSIVDTSKARNLGELLCSLPQEAPVVVFARFISDLDTIQRVALQHGRTYAELSGRRKQLGVWQAGNASVLGLQTQSGREGLELVRGCTAIYYSLGFSLTDFLQSKERLQGTNQTEQVSYHYLIADMPGLESVDRYVLAALAKYEATSTGILRGAQKRKAETSFVRGVVGSMRSGA